MQMPRRRKCRHCQELFKLDPRNAAKQKYCSKPECRQRKQDRQSEEMARQTGEPKLLPGP